MLKIDKDSAKLLQSQLVLVLVLELHIMIWQEAAGSHSRDSTLLSDDHASRIYRRCLARSRR